MPSQLSYTKRLGRDERQHIRVRPLHPAVVTHERPPGEQLGSVAISPPAA